MTATITLTDSAELRAVTRPRVGVLGIMQELYDDMLPGITERQGRYLADVAAALEGVAETVVEPPARNRADVERVVRAH